MRSPLVAAACAALALTPAAGHAAAAPSTATAVLSAYDTSPVRALTGFCSWNGAVLVGYAHSHAVYPDQPLDINVRCWLVDKWGNTLAEVHEGTPGPNAQGYAVAVPDNPPARLCGRANAYFTGGGTLSAGSCATPVPGA